MRRQTSYRRLDAELPAFGTLATTRSGEVGEVIAHEDGQARLQFAGHVQGLYAPDEITWQHVGAQTEGKWQTEGSELHLADRDYPELADILTKPAPAIVQEGNEWGRTASKTAKYSCDNPNCKDTGPLNPEPGGGNTIGRCPSCNSRCWAGSASSGQRPIKTAKTAASHYHCGKCQETLTRGSKEQFDSPTCPKGGKHTWEEGVGVDPNQGSFSLAASKTASDEVDVFGYPFSREQAQKLHDYLDGLPKNKIDFRPMDDLLNESSAYTADGWGISDYNDDWNDATRSRGGGSGSAFKEELARQLAGKTAARAQSPKHEQYRAFDGCYAEEGQESATCPHHQKYRAFSGDYYTPPKTSSKTATRHLTLTGPHAGQPICGAPMDSADQNVHAAYAPEAMLSDPATCAACRAAWIGEDDPTKAPDTNQGQLFASRKLAWEIEDVRSSVDQGWYGQSGVDGTKIDQFSASALTQVYDALSPENQAKLSAMPIERAVDVAFKLIKKHQGSVTAGDSDRVRGTNNDSFWESVGYGQTDAERERNGIGVSEHTDDICPGSGKVQNSGGRCTVCGKPVGGWETKDGMVRKWHSASKTADGPGSTETVYDPFNAFTPKAGECPSCFGEGAFSELNPDGKGFGEEKTCPDCGGTGKA
jgi:hypothetical protein